MIQIKISPMKDSYYYIRTKIEIIKNKKLLEVFLNVENPQSKKIYEHAKIYAPSFLEPLANIYEKLNFSYRLKDYNFLDLFGSYKLNHYLTEATTSKEREYVLDQIKSKKIDLEKLHIFIYSLENVAEIYYSGKKKVMGLKRLFINAKFGLLNKHLVNSPLYYSCITTLEGFIRSFKEDKIFTTKVKIDGDLRRVFIKTPINTYSVGGHNPLFLDSKTLNIYAFKTDKKGKIIDFSLRMDNFKISSMDKMFLKKEMLAYVKRAKENINKYRTYLNKKRITTSKTPKKHFK